MYLTFICSELRLYALKSTYLDVAILMLQDKEKVSLRKGILEKVLRILTKHFVLLRESSIFAPLEPAKPLNNAQIGGSFFL